MHFGLDVRLASKRTRQLLQTLTRGVGVAPAISRRPARLAQLGAVILLLGAPPSAATDGGEEDRRLEELTLEQLMRVEVTTVVGSEQEQLSSPAALYVITPEDIRRAGHRTLEEALRLVPGMFVARSNNSTTIAGARGLVGSILTANRMLVLVDGRVVYDPLLNVTLWDAVDVVIEDVERIEVIRGPGVTLWGVNAMNGVVNVITRSARDTSGLLAVAGAGDPLEGFATVRWGAQRGRTAFRVWGKASELASLENPAGESLHDDLTRVRVGFRADGGDLDGIHWTLQGEAYQHPTHRVSTRQPVPGQHQQFEQLVTEDDVDGRHLRFSLQRGIGESRGWRLHTYWDHGRRETSRIGWRRDTFDIDFRGWSRWDERSSVLWGAQITETEDHIDDGATFLFDPAERSWSTVNAFGQLTRTLIPERLFVLVGSKLTYHDFVGFEVQPSARLWWTPNERSTWWAALSRPVRVPSRLEEDGLIVLSYADPGLLEGGPPRGVRPFGLAGDRELAPETMVAYELGHRFLGPERGRSWQIDTALFFNDYRRLITVPASIIGSFIDTGEADVIGVETRAAVQVGEDWRLEGSASWLDVDVRGPVLEFDEGRTPELMGQLRSTWDVTPRLQLHGALYHVDRLPDPAIDDYQRLDLGLTWRLRDDLELAFWGQNLIDPHVESGAAEIPRGGYLMLRVDR